MAVRPFRIFLIIVFIITAATATILVVDSRLSTARNNSERKFISIYIYLSLAKERYAGRPDSLVLVTSDIFAANHVDSVWMSEYASELTRDLSRGERIWSEIIKGLDSLRAEVNEENPLSP
jgi:hypothetical protein